MSNSSLRKNPKHKNLTNKMLKEKLQEVSNLLVVLEATLMEWEIWHKHIIPTAKDNMTEEEYAHIIKDGPIFTELPEKVMQSIRENMPIFQKPEENPNMPAILDANGNVANDKKLLLDSSGKPII
jgi:hypothetical protein